MTDNGLTSRRENKVLRSGLRFQKGRVNRKVAIDAPLYHRLARWSTTGVKDHRKLARTYGFACPTFVDVWKTAGFNPVKPLDGTSKTLALSMICKSGPSKNTVYLRYPKNLQTTWSNTENTL